jgi:riboflavin kinase/FMN adenylyltransferase
VRLRYFQDLSVQNVVVLPFTRELSQVSAEHFIEQLKEAWPGLNSISVGENFSFGHQRRGNVQLLATLSEELGFTVRACAAVSLGGERISSTRIRRAITEGDFTAAEEMLGRPFGLHGSIVKGDQVGRKIGFPTANLDVTGLTVPPTGVYAGYGLLQGEVFKAMINIGRRPTLASTQSDLRVEAHLLQFSGETYGAELEIRFVAKVREEQKFPSLDHLKRQIAADVEQGSRLLEKGKPVLGNSHS